MKIEAYISGQGLNLSEHVPPQETCSFCYWNQDAEP
jgi:hypothetical protein